MSEVRGALVLWADLPAAKRPLSEKGYDANRLRDELKAKGLRVCLPGRRGRLHPASHNRRLCKGRWRIGNAFARLKEWRGIASYTRCGDLFLSAVALSTTMIFWLTQRVSALIPARDTQRAPPSCWPCTTSCAVFRVSNLASRRSVRRLTIRLLEPRLTWLEANHLNLDS